MRRAEFQPLRLPWHAPVHAHRGPLESTGRRSTDAPMAASAGSLLPSGVCEVEPLAPDDRVGRYLQEAAF